MATVSPTPVPAGPVRRTSQRQALRRPASRATTSRAENHPANAANSSNKGYHDDTSEDEIPVPMKLSALTKALLNDDLPDAVAHESHASAPSPPRTRRQAQVMNGTTSSHAEERRQLRSGSAQPQAATRLSKNENFSQSRDPSPARKRVVRLSGTPQSVRQTGAGTSRSNSIGRAVGAIRPQSREESREESHAEPAEEKQPSSQQDVNTPAQAGRVVRIAVGSSGKGDRAASSGPSSSRSHFDRSTAEKLVLGSESEMPSASRGAPPSQGSISRYPSSSMRGRSDENANPLGSMRVKRVGKISGSFLSGPARRGKMRQSGEEIEENRDGEQAALQPEPEAANPEVPAASSFYGEAAHGFNSGSPVGGSAIRAIHRKHLSSPGLGTNSPHRSPDGFSMPPEPRLPKDMQAQLPATRPHIHATQDKENAVPIVVKKNPVVAVHELKENIVPQRIKSDVVVSERPLSPERKPLAALAQNTPHRPAPPPKMSVLDAATSNAGAATTTTQAKQRRNVLKVNGKCYTRLDYVGRGGTCRVYRVAAENGKMFALKRVSLANVDEVTIRGFRGEIDLLTKLADVERVINLFDHEFNEEKQSLTLLMEIGELDFYTFMRARQNPESSKFDPVFVRYYWKEMLECLQSVHQCDIVHSDLKPANFVLVQGRLKLIDFGIANAIQTDETINVHRETQIGTPNYMSPESLMDSNNSRSGAGGGRMPGRAKLVKLGKPSDIWSLGCILYQLVYGVPPFGHITQPIPKCQAIINWDVKIEFPSRAVGGVPVPPSLLRTMKRCLIREPHMRPTCEELLNDADPFLYPTELPDKALPIDEELLGRIIQSVVSRCRERMPTEAESMSVWPQAYWASVRKAMIARQ